MNGPSRRIFAANVMDKIGNGIAKLRDVLVFGLITTPLILTGCAENTDSIGAGAHISLKQQNVSLGKLAPGFVPESLTVSPDGKRVAYVANPGDHQFVMVDGVAGPSYDRIVGGRVKFGPGSRRVAYIGDRGGYQKLIIDGLEDIEYEEIEDQGAVFSHDGRRVAYIADNNFVVTDGLAGDAYDVILHNTLRFSPNDRRLAYTASRVGRWFVIVDGREGPGV